MAEAKRGERGGPIQTGTGITEEQDHRPIPRSTSSRPRPPSPRRASLRPRRRSPRQSSTSAIPITAPVAGRLGLARYTVGSPGVRTRARSRPSSVVIRSTSISADPAAAAGGEARDLKARGPTLRRGGTLRLPDGSLYDQDGRINFVDVTTNTSTDSVTVRAEITQSRRHSLVGCPVRGRGVAGRRARIRHRRAAVGAAASTSRGQFVLIVDAENKAQVRRVETGPSRVQTSWSAADSRKGNLGLPPACRRCGRARRSAQHRPRPWHLTA